MPALQQVNQALGAVLVPWRQAQRERISALCHHPIHDALPHLPVGVDLRAQRTTGTAAIPVRSLQHLPRDHRDPKRRDRIAGLQKIRARSQGARALADCSR